MTAIPSVKLIRVDTRESLTQPDGPALEPPDNKKYVEGFIPGALKGLLSQTLGDKLVYTLEVRAATERASVSKGRAFVRAKNPFSPTVVKVDSGPELKNQTGLRNTYTVALGVEKP